MIGVILEDILNIVVWFQPVVWMMMFYVKSTRFDRVLEVLAAVAMVAMEVIYFAPLSWPSEYSFVPLFTLYGFLALAFAFILMGLDWHAPQALSAGFLTSFTGSYFWEVPIIIKNAFITGPTGDWFLHAFGLFYVWFMADTIGWKTGTRSILLVVSGLIISTVFMLNWPVAPVTNIIESNPEIWNNWYWMANRVIGTLIVFAVIRKTPPVVKKP